MTIKYNNVFIEDTYTICGNYENVCSSLKYNIRKLRQKAGENAELMKKLLDGGAF